MAFFWHCAGVLARIALASLPASSCPRHRCCIGVVAKLAFEGPVGAALAFSGIVLAFCPHCAGVIASIVLLSLSLVLRQRHCPCCVGTFPLVALSLLPLLPLRCRQHCKLVSVQSRSSRNTCWHHCQHRTIIVAVIALALLPSSRRRLCSCRAGIAALGTSASLPASRTGIQPVAGEALLLRSLSSPVALLLYPALAHSDLAFDGLAKAAMAFFWRCAGVLARIALASLPASSCPRCRCCTGVVAELAFEGLAGAALAFAGVALALCPHHAGVIASIVLLSLLQALCWRHCPCCVGAFALVALALLPLSPSHCRQHCKLASAQSRSSCDTCWCHCQHCAIVVAGVALALLPLSCRHLCHCHAGIAALGTPVLPSASRTGIRPVMTQS